MNAKFLLVNKIKMLGMLLVVFMLEPKLAKKYFKTSKF